MSVTFCLTVTSCWASKSILCAFISDPDDFVEYNIDIKITYSTNYIIVYFYHNKQNRLNEIENPILISSDLGQEEDTFERLRRTVS